jgi:ABC-type multidrug transport system fused ATPase/permease subunit
MEKIPNEAASGEAHHQLHIATYWVADLIGYEVGVGLPDWMHAVLHLVLVVGPLALVVAGAVTLWRIAHRVLRRRREPVKDPVPRIPGLAQGIYAYVLRHSRTDQVALMLIGLAALPVLYATLELPKLIVNNAIDSDHFPIVAWGMSLSQLDFLFVLCALYLLAVLANGALKFFLNVYKGRVGERLLRRLRLTVFRRWRAGAGSRRRSEVVPLIAQEVEPIGGFAGDAFALPVFQGGTFATILVFMFVQDPVLGAAAVTLLPLQLWLIPRLQHRLNRLARARVAEMRALGGDLGEQSVETTPDGLHAVAGRLKKIEGIRLEIHRVKFFMKALTNFLTALTPFFFYAIGGYLVIDGRLSLGALVAVLAAYKDFSAPLRELFRYYQATEDVRIRYGEVLNYLSGSASTVRSADARRVPALWPGTAPAGGAAA